MHSPSTTLRLGLQLFVLMLAVSCGGSGPVGGGESVGAFKGRLLFPSPIRESALYLDLSTRHYSQVPGIVWSKNEDETGCVGSTDYWLTASPGGDRLLESRKRCRRIENQAGDWYSHFLVRHINGEILDGFVVREEGYDSLLGAARLSPDGNYVAIGGRYNDSQGTFGLQLFGIDGTWLGASLENEVHSGYDWLPDNRVIYASGQSIYIAPAGSASGQPWLTFDSNAGKPGDLAVSPDGKQLAFTMFWDIGFYWSFGDIWIADVVSGATRRLAFTARSSAGLNTPVWSPDGQWIGFLYDVPGHANELAPAGYFIVPSVSEDIEVSEAGVSDEYRIWSWLSDTNPGLPPEYTDRFSRQGAPIAWLP